MTNTPSHLDHAQEGGDSRNPKEHHFKQPMDKRAFVKVEVCREEFPAHHWRGENVFVCVGGRKEEHSDFASIILTPKAAHLRAREIFSACGLRGGSE